jgi:hypothetical protein
MHSKLRLTAFEAGFVKKASLGTVETNEMDVVDPSHRRIQVCSFGISSFEDRIRKSGYPALLKYRIYYHFFSSLKPLTAKERYLIDTCTGCKIAAPMKRWSETTA